MHGERVALAGYGDAGAERLAEVGLGEHLGGGTHAVHAALTDEDELRAEARKPADVVAHHDRRVTASAVLDNEVVDDPRELCGAQDPQFVRPCWYRAFVDDRPEVAISPRLSRTPGDPRAPSPAYPGADTDTVLADYGFSTTEIADLRERGAIS